MDRDGLSRRRNALIATAVAIPVTFVLALVLTNGRVGTSTRPDQPAITAQPSVLSPISLAPPSESAATAASCTKVLDALPVTLQDLAPRAVRSSSPFVVAWGEPAVVLRCGVGRPAALLPGSDALLFQAGQPLSVYWLPVNQPTQNIFTTVDRAVFIEVTVPARYRQPPLSPLSDAIASALARTCTVPAPGTTSVVPPPSTLCTRR